MASANQTPRGYKFALLVASQQWRVSQYVSACFGLSSPLALPVTFGHTTVCRSLTLAFTVAIHFVMKYSGPFSAVLRHSPSSWAAVVHWSALMESSEVVQEIPHPLFFLAPHTARAPPQFSEIQDMTTVYTSFPLFCFPYFELVLQVEQPV